ncbi:MAG: hypothetical protein ACI9HK_001233 [Pirellulaceae bacterium]|jgi:hypothetical protein
MTTINDKSGTAISDDASVAATSTTATCQSADGCQEAVRSLAYSKWEAAECPTGDGVDFWLEAEQEVDVNPNGPAPR